MKGSGLGIAVAVPLWLILAGILIWFFFLRKGRGGTAGNLQMVSTGVTVLGLGLVAANTLTGTNVKNIQGVLQGGGDPTKAHASILAIGAQVLFVLVLAFIADASPDAGTVIIALLLGLWLVWAVGNSQKIASVGKFLGIGNA